MGAPFPEVYTSQIRTGPPLHTDKYIPIPSVRLSMQTTVIDSALLSRILKTAAVCGDEMQIQSDDGGWHAATLDPSHTAISTAEVPAGSFASYAPMGTFRFRIADLDPILRCRGDVALKVTGGALEASSGTLSRRTPLFAPEAAPEYPSFGHDDLVTFEADLVRDAVMAFDARRTALARLAVTDAALTVTVGEGADFIRAAVPAGDCLEWERSSSGDTRVILGLDWLQRYMRSVPTGALVTLELATDRPLTARVVSGGAELGWVCAPVLEGA